MVPQNDGLFSADSVANDAVNIETYTSASIFFYEQQDSYVNKGLYTFFVDIMYKLSKNSDSVHRRAMAT